MSDQEFQIQLEKIHNKNLTLPRLRELYSIPMIVDHIRDNGIPLNFGIDLLCHIALHRRASFKTLMGILHHHFGDADSDLQNCADMLVKAFQIDLCDYDSVAQEFIVKIPIPADVKADLDRFQYPLPMVLEPRKLNHNRSSAYFTGGGSVILKKHNHHDDDVCLDHLNKANAVPLKINADTSRMVDNHWKDLDHQKGDETREEYKKRVAAFLQYDRNARDVMELMFMAGNKFFLTHKYDKRGRTYAQGYHINSQGSPWNKAVIEFAEGETVNGT